ncbi:MAG: pyruvate synthase [Gemmataceae bacterium]
MVVRTPQSTKASSRRMLTGNSAAAWGARLADIDYVPAFPITPQTEIIEKLSNWFADETLFGRFVTLDSEHSMITAAGAGAATGCRVFSATSSQGLLYGMESLYTVAGWRVPFVLVNVSRALSAPITLEPDHNDILAARDTGCVQLHAETCQEVLDLILQAYRIAEDSRVLLPVIVNLDGFYLSFTREPVDIPSQEQARRFLPAFTPQHAEFRASAPRAQGVAVLGGQLYSHFKQQTHLATRNAMTVYQEVAEEFSEIFGRDYDVLDAFQMEDADYALVMIGSFASKAKAAVLALRAEGKRVGLVRLRMVRPFPAVAVGNALAGRRVAVIDQNVSPGLGGILYHEIAASVYHRADRPEVLRSFIGGLGGKDITLGEFRYLVDALERSRPEDVLIEPQFLSTEADKKVVRRMVQTALELDDNPEGGEDDESET